MTPGTLPSSITFGTVNNNEILTLASKPIIFKLKAVLTFGTSPTPVYSQITLTLIHECTSASAVVTATPTTSLSVHNLQASVSTSIPSNFVETQPGTFAAGYCFIYGLYSSTISTTPIASFTTLPVFEAIGGTPLTLSIGRTSSYGT